MGITSVAMYPVDVIRGITMANPGTSALQAYRGFIGAHGYSGFLKQGMAAEVTLRSISRTVKFFMQPVCHRVLFGKSDHKRAFWCSRHIPGSFRHLDVREFQTC